MNYADVLVVGGGTGRTAAAIKQLAAEPRLSL